MAFGSAGGRSVSVQRTSSTAHAMPTTTTNPRVTVFMRSLFNPRFITLFKISPAEDKSGHDENDGDIDQRVQRSSEDKSCRWRAAVRCRSNKTVVSEIRQQIVQTGKQPARACASQRDGETLQVSTKVANNEDQKGQQS